MSHRHDDRETMFTLAIVLLFVTTITTIVVVTTPEDSTERTHVH